MNLLNTAGLLGGLEKYAADIVRKRSSSPKFQVYNTALISAQRNEYFDEIIQKPSEWGRLVESAIGAYLINNAQELGLNLFYWRDRNEEVDFVLEKRGKVVAIEVKTGFDRATSGMQAFSHQFSPEKILVVGRSGIPWQDFYASILLICFPNVPVKRNHNMFITSR